MKVVGDGDAIVVVVVGVVGFDVALCKSVQLPGAQKKRVYFCVSNRCGT